MLIEELADARVPEARESLLATWVELASYTFDNAEPLSFHWLVSHQVLS